MATWWAPWTWFGEGRSDGDNFIRNSGLTEEAGRIGIPVNEKTALQLAAVFCAVRVIAEGIGQLPLKVLEETEVDGLTRRKAAVNHPAYRLLHRQPNSWMTSFEWRELMTMHAVLLGNGFSIINRVNGQPDELIPVHPDAVQVKFKGGVVSYRITMDGDAADYDRSEIFHLRGPSMDGVAGLPIVRLATAAIGLAKALENAQIELQSNGGRPSGILSAGEKAVTNEVKTSLAQQWREKFGPGGKGGVAVLDGGWTYAAMTMTAVDAQTLESRRMQVEDIGRVFRVLPIMIMQADKAATYASSEQFFIAHVVHTLDPWISRWEQALDRDFFPEPNIYAHFQVNALMRGAAKDRADFYSKGLGAGGSPAFLTQNDVRALEDMDPLPGGDVLFAGAMNAPAAQATPTLEDTPDGA